MKNLISSISWQPNRNIGLTLGAALRRVVWLRDGGPTRNWVSTVLYFGRFVGAIQSKNGWKGVVAYLKACHVLLSQVLARNPIKDSLLLGARVKRSRQGLPLVIPPQMRVAIMSFDKWTIKIWSTLFWLYRVIEIPGKLKLSSITKPFEVNYLIVTAWTRWIGQFLPVFLKVLAENSNGEKRNRYLQLSRKATDKVKANFLEWKYVSEMLVQSTGIIPIFAYYISAFTLPTYKTRMICRAQKMWELDHGPEPYGRVSKDPGTYFPGVIESLKPELVTLLKSGPNSAKSMDEGPGPTTRTSIGSILTDLFLMRSTPHVAKHVQSFFPEQIEFARSLMVSAKRVFEELKDHEAEWGVFINTTPLDHSDKPPSDAPLPGFSNPWGLGKLAFIPEAAGKVRVVAMVDYLTQMLLKPLHQGIFDILRLIPQDGTFDQHKPVRLLAAMGRKPYYCYDLSAATDRFPATMLQVLLSFILNSEVAKGWRAFLNAREFIVPRRISEKQRVPRTTPTVVKYGAGQPMGAYGHWAVFSLGHHFLVQFAAFQASGRLEWFALYALLGDDIVIADAKVAEHYLALLRALGVEVGLAKSIISRNGVIEFAKRTWRVTSDGSLVDFSGISLKEIGACYTNPDAFEGLLSHTDVRGHFAALLRITRVLGYGRKTRSQLSADFVHLRPYIKGMALLLTRPGSVFGMETFTQWITQLSPTRRGVLREKDDLVVLDAVRQSLLARLDTAVRSRMEYLRMHRNPISLEEVDGKVEVKFDSDLMITPDFLRFDGKPEYQAFLNQTIWSPFVRNVYKEICELIGDVHLWKDGDPLTGDFSLDEIYSSLTRLNESLASLPVSVDLLHRPDSSEKKDRKRRVRVRSSSVKMWNKLQGVIRGALVR